MPKLVKGNEAAVYGALLAGCTSYYGYPITPASEVAHTAAATFPLLGRTFLQAESEVAAINMVYGAAAAGERTMTASSGPGISLKAEGISYLAAAELPCLIVNVMRAGPGLGNIGPEQSDYNQAVKGGGHGNYRLIVLAPNSAQEMCDMAIEGFELAERYRTPTLMLSDAVIGQMMEPVDFPAPLPQRTIPDWAVYGDAAHRHGCHTSIFLDFEELDAHNRKLLEKYARIEAEVERYEGLLLEDAELVLIGYGITSRLLAGLVVKLRESGIKAGLFRPISLWPFPARALRRAASGRKLFVAEMSMGMLVDDVRLTLPGEPVGFFASYGGNLPVPDELEAAVRLFHERGEGDVR